MWAQIAVPPGGNRVRSYLDVLAPDDISPGEVDLALTGLWLDLVADELGPAGRRLPNPVVIQRGRVVLRFGVDLPDVSGRSLELVALRERVNEAVVWKTGR